MATPHRLTISEIDFKIRCIAHFMKVYEKTVDGSVRSQMLDQTVRANREIIALVGESKTVSIAARKLRDKYDLKKFIALALGANGG